MVHRGGWNPKLESPQSPRLEVALGVPRVSPKEGGCSNPSFAATFPINPSPSCSFWKGRLVGPQSSCLRDPSEPTSPLGLPGFRTCPRGPYLSGEAWAEQPQQQRQPRDRERPHDAPPAR